MKYKLPIDGEWREFDDKKLAEMPADSREWVMDQLVKYNKNPLANFLPHGMPWRDQELVLANGKIKLPPSDYPAEWRNDGVAFLNDRENLYAMLLSGRKYGKTAHGCAFTGIRGFPMDPEAPIFTQNGVEYHEWEGPQRIVVASLGSQNLIDLWSVYQEILPRDELGAYAKDWGKYEGEHAQKRKTLPIGTGRPVLFTSAKSGVEMMLLTYNQNQAVWESFKAWLLHADEQIKLNLLMAWEDGSSSYGAYTPACFTLSGFSLEERPEDTGAAGPLKPIWDAGRSGMKTVGRYNLDVSSTPDAILHPQKKQERYDRYVNPDLVTDAKILRRGQGVYYPGWEPGGGLIFGADVWERELHVIPRLWKDDNAPEHWPKWRVIDYADKKTTVCGWFAMGPRFSVCYRMLYQSNLLVAEAAEMIIEMSHNRRQLVGEGEDETTGNIIKYYEEIQCGEQYEVDMMDTRAKKWRQQGEEVGDLFGRYGLENIEEAPTGRDRDMIPTLKDRMRIDPRVPHPVYNMDKDPEGVMGASLLYFFDGECDKGLDELDKMPEYMGTSEIIYMDRKKPHDFIDIMKYWACAQPEYHNVAEQSRDADEADREEGVAPYTGY